MGHILMAQLNYCFCNKVFLWKNNMKGFIASQFGFTQSMANPQHFIFINESIMLD